MIEDGLHNSNAAIVATLTVDMLQLLLVSNLWMELDKCCYVSILITCVTSVIWHKVNILNREQKLFNIMNNVLSGSTPLSNGLLIKVLTESYIFTTLVRGMARKLVFYDLIIDIYIWAIHGNHVKQCGLFHYCYNHRSIQMLDHSGVVYMI